MVEEYLKRQVFENILQVENIANLTYLDLVELFDQEEELSDYLPDGVYQVDPRSDERVLYNSARAIRPHDNKPSVASTQRSRADIKPCVICLGKTTGAVDVADLSEGFTFINKNLYPILYPERKIDPLSSGVVDDTALNVVGMPACGLHFLQWTSSFHDKDWHNMPRSDRVIVFRRLADLEEVLLNTSAGSMPSTQSFGDLPGRFGYVSIIKNGGRLVGGSLTHGHQQIAFSNVMPRRMVENLHFETQKGETFSSFMLRENPSELLIRDYETAVLLVPYFMRRPFDMMLLVKDSSKRYLHDLTDAEIAAVADGWCDVIRLVHLVMPQLGKEIAYNVITYNGPGAGLYFEFLPYTQEAGGFERMGLSVCQANPLAVAEHLRTLIDIIGSD